MPVRSKSSRYDYDIIIVGAGPAGLSFAALAAPAGWRILLLEAQKEAQLATPADDGREIALTHHSRSIMERAGLWQQLPPGAIGSIHHAKVSNLALDYALHFDHHESGQPQLGFMVANHAIRKAAYQATRKHRNITIMAGQTVTAAHSDSSGAQVTLQNGKTLHAPLLLAADSRFSPTRRWLGIGARQRDFGRSCIVTRVRHSQPHEETAHECFLRDHTLAILPLQGRVSSLVLTVDSGKAEDWLHCTDKEFATRLERDVGEKIGALRVEGKRFHYPLVGVFADRFCAPRAALLGDAAVGMHPVTAHGFNFGLRGAATLAEALQDTAALGLPLGEAQALHRYDVMHRQATWPLYQATNLLVSLYTDTRPQALFARRTLLRLGNALAPARRMIIDQLTEAA